MQWETLVVAGLLCFALWSLASVAFGVLFDWLEPDEFPTRRK